jgi:hypothetical protein
MDLLARPQHQHLADSLKLELFLGIIFWLPYAMPEGFSLVDRWPWIGLPWIAIWFASPLLCVVALMMVPRDLKLPLGRTQVVIAATIAVSIWAKFSTVELC